MDRLDTGAFHVGDDRVDARDEEIVGDVAGNRHGETGRAGDERDVDAGGELRD